MEQEERTVHSGGEHTVCYFKFHVKNFVLNYWSFFSRQQYTAAQIPPTKVVLLQ